MKPTSNERIAWDRVALLVAIVLVVGWFVVGCTLNTGQCPPQYRYTELRGTGKAVLWCIR